MDPAADIFKIFCEIFIKYIYSNEKHRAIMTLIGKKQLIKITEDLSNNKFSASRRFFQWQSVKLPYRSTNGGAGDQAQKIIEEIRICRGRLCGAQKSAGCLRISAHRSAEDHSRRPQHTALKKSTVVVTF
jgi:hypothetical protein